MVCCSYWRPFQTCCKLRRQILREKATTNEDVLGIWYLDIPATADMLTISLFLYIKDIFSPQRDRQDVNFLSCQTHEWYMIYSMYILRGSVVRKNVTVYISMIIQSQILAAYMRPLFCHSIKPQQELVVKSKRDITFPILCKCNVTVIHCILLCAVTM